LLRESVAITVIDGVAVAVRHRGASLSLLHLRLLL
jgi:hypothetical protein